MVWIARCTKDSERRPKPAPDSLSAKASSWMTRRIMQPLSDTLREDMRTWTGFDLHLSFHCLHHRSVHKMKGVAGQCLCHLDFSSATGIR